MIKIKGTVCNTGKAFILRCTSLDGKDCFWYEIDSDCELVKIGETVEVTGMVTKIDADGVIFVRATKVEKKEKPEFTKRLMKVKARNILINRVYMYDSYLLCAEKLKLRAVRVMRAAYTKKKITLNPDDIWSFETTTEFN